MPEPKWSVCPLMAVYTVNLINHKWILWMWSAAYLGYCGSTLFSVRWTWIISVVPNEVKRIRGRVGSVEYRAWTTTAFYNRYIVVLPDPHAEICRWLFNFFMWCQWCWSAPCGSTWSSHALCCLLLWVNITFMYWSCGEHSFSLTAPSVQQLPVLVWAQSPPATSSLYHRVL